MGHMPCTPTPFSGLIRTPVGDKLAFCRGNFLKIFFKQNLSKNSVTERRLEILFCYNFSCILGIIMLTKYFQMLLTEVWIIISIRFVFQHGKVTSTYVDVLVSVYCPARNRLEPNQNYMQRNFHT